MRRPVQTNGVGQIGAREYGKATRIVVGAAAQTKATDSGADGYCPCLGGALDGIYSASWRRRDGQSYKGPPVVVHLRTSYRDSSLYTIRHVSGCHAIFWQ